MMKLSDRLQGWIAIILNWASLVFSSPANLIIPFLLYLVSKRYKASALLDPCVVSEPPAIVIIHTNTEADPHHESATGGTAHPNKQAEERVSLSKEVIEVVSQTQQMTETISLNQRMTPAISLNEETTDTTLLHKPMTLAVNIRAPQPRLPLLQTTNLKPETDDCIRLVRSPSRHRYYGQNHPDTGAASDAAPENKNDANNNNNNEQHNVFLTLPDSPTSPRSARPRSTGTDEFRLLPIVPVVVTPAAIDRLSSSPTMTLLKSPEEEELATGCVNDSDVVDPVPPLKPAVFEAFPFLRRLSWCTSSRVAAVECVVIVLLVVAAFVDSVIQSVKPQ